MAHVALEVRTFLPREHGSHDSRELGVAVCSVEMCTRGADQEPCGTASLAWEFDWPAATACVRRLGMGATLAVPCRDSAQFNEAVVQAISHPEKLVPGVPAIPAAVNDIDGIYATQLSDGVLYYNAVSPPYQIGYEKRFLDH